MTRYRRLEGYTVPGHTIVFSFKAQMHEIRPLLAIISIPIRVYQRGWYTSDLSKLLPV